MQPTIFRAAPLLLAISFACSEPVTVNPIEHTACPPWAVGAQCGVFTVPENRSDDNGRRVSLAFIVLAAQAAVPASDPVFYVAGGPGQTLTEIAHTFNVDALRSSRDIVLLDQRGTSISPRLDCPQTATGAQALLSPTFDVVAMMACRNALQGIADLRQYSTMETVADLEAFRHALGYQRVNLIGASYGTRVILQYMRQAPASIRSAVLTSAVPLSFRNPLYHAQSAQSGLDTLFAWCAADASCRTQYPSPREDLEVVLSRLAQQAVTTEADNPFTNQRVTVQLTRDAVADALRVMMYGRGTGHPIPRLLREAAEGNYESLARSALQSLGSLRTGLRHGLLMSVVCTEDVPRINESEIPALTNGTFLGDTRVRMQMAACAEWPKGEVPADFGNEVVSSVPSLVISGRFDPVTPPKWGDLTVANLSNGRHIVTDGAHSPGSACLSGLIASFVASADAAALDVTCALQPMVNRRSR